MSNGTGSGKSWRDRAIGAVVALIVFLIGMALWFVFISRPYDDALLQRAATQEEQQRETEVAQAAALNRLRIVQDQLRTETQGGSDEEGPCPKNTASAVVAAAVDHVFWVESKTLAASSKEEWVAVWVLLTPEVMNDRFGPCEFMMDPGGIDELQLRVSVEPQDSSGSES